MNNNKAIETIKLKIVSEEGKRDSCYLRLELAIERCKENIAFGYLTKEMVEKAKALQVEKEFCDCKIETLKEVLNVLIGVEENEQ